jgi:hypothetical protein
MARTTATAFWTSGGPVTGSVRPGCRVNLSLSMVCSV